MNKGAYGYAGRKQKGAAAIEFAMVFVLFFIVFYGAVSYSLPLMMVQTFNHASSEAVRRAIALQPGAANYSLEAQTVVAQQISWMPAAVRSRVVISAPAPAANGIFTVRISYPYRQFPLVPFLVFPGIGEIPRLPNVLEATASIRLGD